MKYVTVESIEYERTTAAADWIKKTPCPLKSSHVYKFFSDLAFVEVSEQTGWSGGGDYSEPDPVFSKFKKVCPSCKGVGHRIEKHRTAEEGVQKTVIYKFDRSEHCVDCGGHGRGKNARCVKCMGTGGIFHSKSYGS